MLSFLRIFIVLATVVGLAGCTPTASTSPTTDAGMSVIGVLVGSGPARAALPTTATLVATAAGGSGAHVVVDQFGSGPGSSHVTYSARVAAGNGQNALTRKTQLQQAENELVQAITGTPATTSSGPVDVISGVRAMDAHLHAIPHTAADVVILGNAMQAAAPVNLADPTQLADPTTTLGVVTSRGLLPTCKGWRVYMIGGSLTAQGGLDTLRDKQLREFWRGFFAKCGGQLVVWDTALTAFPTSRGEVAPATWTTTGTLIVPLPATVLFEPDLAVFRPGAREGLDQLVVLLTRTYPTATAEVAGYTATVDGGTQAGATALSQARAQAVTGYLTAHGVAGSRLSAVGRGDHDPVATNATEAGRALNRRVVVTLHVQ